MTKAKDKARNEGNKASCDSPAKGGFSDYLPDKGKTKLIEPPKSDS